MGHDAATLAGLLSGAGFIAPEEETAELLKCAAGDPQLLDSLIARRLTGEPLAWITGSISFCNLEIRVDPASTSHAGTARHSPGAPSYACRQRGPRSTCARGAERLPGP